MEGRSFLLNYLNFNVSFFLDRRAVIGREFRSRFGGFELVSEFRASFGGFELVSEVSEKVSSQTLIPKLVSEFGNSFGRHLYVNYILY